MREGGTLLGRSPPPKVFTPCYFHPGSPSFNPATLQETQALEAIAVSKVSLNGWEWLCPVGIYQIHSLFYFFSVFFSPEIRSHHLPEVEAQYFLLYLVESWLAWHCFVNQVGFDLTCLFLQNDGIKDPLCQARLVYSNLTQPYTVCTIITPFTDE